MTVWEIQSWLRYRALTTRNDKRFRLISERWHYLQIGKTVSVCERSSTNLDSPHPKCVSDRLRTFRSARLSLQKDAIADMFVTNNTWNKVQPMT